MRRNTAGSQTTDTDGSSSHGGRKSGVHHSVIKPQAWDISELLPDDEDENIPKWKKYAKIILPHIGLIVLSLSYVVAGAAAFYYLERDNELTVRRENLYVIDAKRRDFLERLWELLHKQTTTYADYELTSVLGMDNITQVLFRAFDTHYVKAIHLDKSVAAAYHNGTWEGIAQDGTDNEDTWTFITAVFFTSTLLTTIGYGNLVPVTFEGRMFCICYGLFGVPLILITVADIGKFLSENIVWLYFHYVDWKQRTKKRIRQRFQRRRQHRSVATTSMSPNQTQQEQPLVTSSNQVKDGEDAVESLTTADPASLPVEHREEDRVREELEKFGLEDYVSIPISLVLLILVGYITIGAVLLGSWERWDFFTGFYFSFITMTTVGFGDIVPTIQKYYLLDLLYIIIGLAITTMCIDLVGIQYIRRIHYFGRAIEDARFALVNVGGRMVHVPDLMRYATVLQQKYGLRRSDAQRSALTELAGLADWPGAYTPPDIKRIRYIDYRTSLTTTSCESIHSYLSSCLPTGMTKMSSRSRSNMTNLGRADVTIASGNGSVYNIVEEHEVDV